MKFWRDLPYYTLILGGCLIAALWGNRTVTAWVAASPIENRICIIIDAGHGEPDGGSVSCTGVEEDDINLEIAWRLNDLMHLLGYDTKMLRTTEESVYTEGESIGAKKRSDLANRVRMVNETENAVLLSIHQNHYSESQYAGAQMFWANTEGSEPLAKALQAAFVAYLNPGSNRQAKKCTAIYLMEHVRCPAVLVECGFLSNPEEEAKLRSAEYQKQVCCVIGTALSNYLANT